MGNKDKEITLCIDYNIPGDDLKVRKQGRAWKGQK